MNVSTVENLLEILEKIEDKSLPIRCVIEHIQDYEGDDVNLWLNGIEVSEKGQSGYELDGEVRLVFGE